MPPLAWELLKIAGVLVMVIVMIFVLRWRRRSFHGHLDEMAEQEVCEHLKPALQLLKSRGHRILDVGQKSAEYVLELDYTLVPLAGVAIRPNIQYIASTGGSANNREVWILGLKTVVNF